MDFQGFCPVCDATLSVSKDSEVSELISCSDCRSRLQVLSLRKQRVGLGVAPDVEEDWGE